MVGARRCSASACSSSRSTTPSSTSPCRRWSRTSTPPPASCSGSSTATRWSSPACCSPPAAWATASAARARLTIGLVDLRRRLARRPVRPRTPTMLILTRAFMGIGAALIMPATLSLLTNVFPDPQERARAIGVWAGGRRRRRRHRPADRRLPAPALLVGLGLPRQRAGRASSPSSPAASCCRTSKDPRRPGSTRSAPSSRSSAWSPLLWAHHRGARRRAGPTRRSSVGFVVGVARARRLRRLGAAQRPPDARRALLQEPALHGGQHRHHADLLRPVRVDVPRSPSTCRSVLGYSALAGRRAHAADGVRDADRRPAGAPARRAGRHQARRRRPGSPSSPLGPGVCLAGADDRRLPAPARSRWRCWRSAWAW